jgi:GntR family transcriptional regulator/MocR family aminotransferase
MANGNSQAWLALFASQANDARSLREQTCAAVRQAINSGQLQFGERLPSSRLLAGDLGVSRVTVEAAYSQLEAEGYLTRKAGGGTFAAVQVNHSAPLRPSKTAVTLSKRGDAIVASGGCFDPLMPHAFDAGSPDLQAFPLDIWQKLSHRLLRRSGRGLLGYGDPAGYRPLREAIAHYLNQSRGVCCDAEQVIVVSSSQQALQLTASLLLDVGDTVWLEEPGYLGARNAYAAQGARLVPVPVDVDGMDAKQAQGKSPKLIYLTPSHQYPTGASLSLSRRVELLEFAHRFDSWIVEDDYDSEFHYDGRPLPAMQGLDRHGRVIYVGTFSKVLFPSLRLGYLVLPPGMVDAFTLARTVQDGHSAQWTQAVTAAFIEEGHFASHLRHMRQLYHSRRDLLLSEIGNRLDGWLEPLPASGGLKLATWLPRGKEEKFTRSAARLGVATPGLSAQYLETPKDGWLLGFAGLSNEQIREGVAILERVAANGR